MQSDAARELLDNTFEELVLIMGGAFAVHQFSDEAVWQIMKSLDELHSKAVAKLQGLGHKENSRPERGSFEPHPAVEAFLKKLQRNSQ